MPDVVYPYYTFLIFICPLLAVTILLQNAFLNGAIVSGKSWHMISYIMIDISDRFMYDNNTRKR